MIRQSFGKASNRKERNALIRRRMQTPLGTSPYAKKTRKRRVRV